MTAAEPNRERRRIRHVLIVEDNPDGRESLRLLLELLGYQVEVAADGVEGVRKALQGHPEVAIVDIGLPRLDGYQVARKVRNALGPDVLLIAYTACDAEEVGRRVSEAGFDVHLVKPAALEQLAPCLAGRPRPGRGRPHGGPAGGENVRAVQGACRACR
jgi:two-component system, sensor histidine kinase